MPSKSSNWGVWLFGISLSAAGVLYHFFSNSGKAAFNADVIKNLQYAGLTASILCILTGSLSYSRIQNFKIYMTGYMTGMLGLAYFVLGRGMVIETWRASSIYFMDILYVLVFATGLLVSVLPSYITYWISKRITYSLLLIEGLLLYGAGHHLENSRWVEYILTFKVSEINILVPVLFCLSVIASIVYTRRQFHLGGVLSGAMLFYFWGWFCREFISGYQSLELLAFVVAPVYFIAGTLVHWVMFIQHKGERDPLLGIYNRAYCNKIVSERIKNSTSAPLGVAMVDIDHFKKVNDKYGHQAGDQVLVNTASQIQREARPKGIVCRYGGEEIVAFFPGWNAGQTKDKMEQIRKNIKSAKVKWGRKQIKVSISCGVSHRESSSQTIHDVIEAADKALYRAKKGGRNQVRTGKVRKTRGAISTIKIKVLGGETADDS